MNALGLFESLNSWAVTFTSTALPWESYNRQSWLNSIVGARRKNYSYAKFASWWQFARHQCSERETKEKKDRWREKGALVLRKLPSTCTLCIWTIRSLRATIYRGIVLPWRLPALWEWLRHTWVRLPGSSSVVCTSCPSRPESQSSLCFYMSKDRPQFPS